MNMKEALPKHFNKFVKTAEIPEIIVGSPEDKLEFIDVELPETPVDFAALFELAYPNKMAYRKHQSKRIFAFLLTSRKLTPSEMT